MTFQKYVTLWCDFNVCHEHFCASSGIVSEARIEAKRHGWEFTSFGEDFCQRHRSDDPVEPRTATPTPTGEEADDG